MMNKKDHILAGDIGGTKTNLGLFVPGKLRPRMTAFERFSSRKFGSLKEIIEKFLERHAVPISGVCFGIAGPVTGGKSKTTNLAWTVSEKALARHFGWPRVKLINDLTATAMALPVLAEAGTFPAEPGPGPQRRNSGPNCARNRFGASAAGIS